MREMPTHMGATGNDRGAEGLPEVQESVLEHAASYTRKEAQELMSVSRTTTLPESKQCCQIGNPHPQYPTLKVCKLNADGSAAAYMPTVWYRDGDPRVVSLINAKALYARLRQIRNDEVSCKPDTQDHPAGAPESLASP